MSSFRDPPRRENPTVRILEDIMGIWCSDVWPELVSTKDDMGRWSVLKMGAGPDVGSSGAVDVEEEGEGARSSRCWYRSVLRVESVYVQ